MLPKSFKPKKNFELIRIGSDNDGGYLVDKNSILDTKNFIAMGLGDDWCFEKDFLKLNNCNIFCFDRKINKNFWKKNILKCFEKFILRKISTKYIPNEITYRNKLGFPVPLDAWLSNEKDKKFIKEILLDDQTKKRGIFKSIKFHI